MSLAEFVFHGACCSCGSALVWHPDADITICAHCDDRHPVIHPSRVCPQCEAIGLNTETARREM